MLELNILISVSGEELLDIFLLFRQEFELSQFVSIVLSFAAEVVSHFSAQGRSVFHFHFSKEFVESPCHFHDTEWCEVLAFPVFESIREDGVSSISLLVFVECREIVYAFVFHRTWFGEAIGDVARYVSVLKSLFQ